MAMKKSAVKRRQQQTVKRQKRRQAIEARSRLLRGLVADPEQKE
jgi:hypothetical protein